MAILPFRWHSRTRLESIRSRIAASADAGLRDWSAAAVENGLEIGGEAEAADWREWREMRTADGTAMLGMSADALSRIGNHLSGLSGAEASELAAGIGLRALRDLLQTMIGAPRGADLVSNGRPPAVSLESRHGAASFSWCIAGIRLALYLDAALCDALAPVLARAVAPLSRREDAVLPERVALAATLDLGSTALKDTLELRLGDVIRTGAKLDAPVCVRAQGGAIVLEGTLVALGEGRGIRISNISHARKDA